jgi:hypothetical protein
LKEDWILSNFHRKEKDATHLKISNAEPQSFESPPSVLDTDWEIVGEAEGSTSKDQQVTRKSVLEEDELRSTSGVCNVNELTNTQSEHVASENKHVSEALTDHLSHFFTSQGVKLKNMKNDPRWETSEDGEMKEHIFVESGLIRFSRRRCYTE